ncbi:MAG: NADH-quinone oxidoreductase subunit C [Chromatiales bacterium]|nr:NADH-quinone oxidoreductase subunit C [Chromatiales bacterium]
MSKRTEKLATAMADRFGERITRVSSRCGELTFELAPADIREVCTALRDEPAFRFGMLIDVCGVDYLGFGRQEWETEDATATGFSRAAGRDVILPEPQDSFPPKRFAVVYHLLSLEHNWRLRLRAFTGEANPPIVPSVTEIWSAADWFEREAFDLFGILFEGHPDLRRLLTDYGFIGHPFRKDFPLSGNVEVRYDPERARVIYQPVSIEPRTLVPRVIRDDNRWEPDLKGRPDG